jgi:hypothetical protein
VIAVIEHWKNRVAIMRIPLQWILVAGVAGAVLGGVSPSRAQQTIRVGWTIPAEESKYWMMRRPAEFPDLGKTYNIEWTQFQGTAPMTQALAGGVGCATKRRCHWRMVWLAAIEGLPWLSTCSKCPAASRFIGRSRTIRRSRLSRISRAKRLAFR